MLILFQSGGTNYAYQLLLTHPALDFQTFLRSKFEEFLRTSSAGHLAVVLIRGDCVYTNQKNIEKKGENLPPWGIEPRYCG